jgi:predicted nucleic acid-binding protein
VTVGTAHGERVVVPDASVILKWIDRFPGEKDRERADALLDAWLNGRLEIVVPPLWAFEVANVLGREDPLGAGPIMEELLGYRFGEADPTPELCRTAFGLMKDFRVTFYDAVYHAVALLRKGVFVTADDAYLRKAGRRGGVALLRDFIPA